MKKSKESANKKINYLVYGSVCFFFGIFLIAQDSQISHNQLEGIEVTLVKKPEFINTKTDHYKLITKEYQDWEFVTHTSATKAINHLEFEKDVQVGDKITLFRKINDYGYNFFGTQINEIYGIRKDGVEYITLEELNIEERKGNLLGIIGIVLGLVSLFYILWDEKIPYDYFWVMGVTFVLVFGLILTLDYYNLLVN